jgi:hypothetical protein
MIELERGWVRFARCRQAETRVFFVPTGHQPDGRERAMHLCSQCKVRTTCYCYATIRNERGIWGGTTEQERDQRRPYILDILIDLWPRLMEENYE